MATFIDDYLKDLLPTNDKWVKQVEVQANKDSIPIIDPLSMDFIMQIIRIKQPRQVLEIGTAIGYSALRMSEANPDIRITTIERDALRSKQAVDNIKKLSKEEQIKVIQGDAIEIMHELDNKDIKFDLIFIDAAKSHYKTYFHHGSNLLFNHGVIITDNILFKNYVINSKNARKRHQEIAKRIATFNKWLSEHPDFHTTFLPIGDGVSLSRKK